MSLALFANGNGRIYNNQMEGQKPNVKISAIEINGKNVKVQTMPPYNLDPLKCSITIHWEVKDGQKDSIYEFKYRLLGASDTWIKLPKDVKSINFNQLQQGKYQFQIFAINIKGYGSEYFSAYHFNINIEWYHSWWFYLFNLIFLCMIFYYLIDRGYKEKMISTYPKENNNNPFELE
jgi:hypothetical protein